MNYKRIKEIREDMDLNQTEMAQKLKTNQNQYSRYETGKREMPIQMLAAFCQITGVSADYILELRKGLSWPR